MNNATVSDTEVSFAASLYEACRRHRLRCSSFAMAELSDQEVWAIELRRKRVWGWEAVSRDLQDEPQSARRGSIPVCRFPIFCSLHQLFESRAAFEQCTFERGLERLFLAEIVERHPVLTNRL